MLLNFLKRPAVATFIRRILEVNFRQHKHLIRRVIAHMGMPDKMIDVGCGAGVLSLEFTKEAYSGIDTDPGFIAYARQKYPRNFIVGEGAKLPFADEQVDFVLIVGVLHHLSTEQCHNVFEEINRVLKPGGSILIIEDTKTSSPVARFIQSHDQGAFIRSRAEWDTLIGEAFKIKESGEYFCGVAYYSYFLLQNK